MAGRFGLRALDFMPFTAPEVTIKLRKPACENSRGKKGKPGMTLWPQRLSALRAPAFAKCNINVASVDFKIKVFKPEKHISEAKGVDRNIRPRFVSCHQAMPRHPWMGPYPIVCKPDPALHTYSDRRCLLWRPIVLGTPTGPTRFP